MPFLEVRGVAKAFGARAVLSDVTLAAEEGDVLALLGPSGSGKTTLLRLLAGFERPDDGDVLVAQESVVAVPPARRGFGMVFQHYALFPHLSVGENVAFGLQGWGLPAERIAARVAEVLELVDLAGFEGRAVTQISGGQQQRVAVARAIAPKPRLLLLDEPLSNLDPELRERTRRRLRETLANVGITTVLVTHEQEEAFDLGDRVAVLAAGRVQQVDRPEVLYRRPANRFVAGFVGRASLLPGRLEPDGRVRVVGEGGGEGSLWRADPAEASLGPNEAVELAVRPEMLEIVARPAGGALPGRVLGSRFAGMVHLVRVALAGGIRLEVATQQPHGADEAVWVAQRAGAPLPRAFSVAAAEPPAAMAEASPGRRSAAEAGVAGDPAGEDRA